MEGSGHSEMQLGQGAGGVLAEAVRRFLITIGNSRELLTAGTGEARV